MWDTALALIALADAGVPADRPGDRRARRDWLLGEEISVKGDWSVRRPDVAPGGWAFEFANDGYPDTDDTAEVVLALLRSRSPDGEPVRERRPAGRDRPRRGLARRDAEQATAAGARSTRTTPARSSTGCRSATSAR